MSRRGAELENAQKSREAAAKASLDAAAHLLQAVSILQRIEAELLAHSEALKGIEAKLDALRIIGP